MIKKREIKGLFHAGGTLEKVSRDAGGLEEEHRLFVPLAFTESQSFL
jgi:hypothetical protein